MDRHTVETRMTPSLETLAASPQLQLLAHIMKICVGFILILRALPVQMIPFKLHGAAVVWCSEEGMVFLCTA